MADGFVIKQTICQMKKSTILCIAIFLMGNHLSFSQDFIIQPKHGIELQFGANSPVISLKYRYLFWLNSQQHISASTGIGMFHGLNFNQDITYSLGDGRNFWEVGILGFYSNVSTYEYRINDNYILSPMTGYKYISSSGLSVRIHFSPFINKNQFYPFGGIAIGYFFKEKKYTQPNQNINTIRFRKD
jgi:hypothetical protein